MRPLHPDTLTIEQIRSWSGALAQLLDDHRPDVVVPTCGEWTLADLVWHLAEVQLFWTHIIQNRPSGPETYRAPTRPDLEADLAAALRSAADGLVDLLSHADPDERAWSWSDDHTVRFTIRRQIHESLVHYIDGVLAVGAPMPDVPSRLAADGIDELVEVMLTGTPEWAEFTTIGDPVVIRAIDTGDQWQLQPGVVVGTEPSKQQPLTLPGYETLTDAEPLRSISGPAFELLLWMWGRLDDEHVVAPSSGDAEAAATLRATIADVTQ